MAEYGTELVTNGGFSSDTAWTKGDQWSIGTYNTQGAAKFLYDGTGDAAIYQGISIVPGRTYTVAFSILSHDGTTGFSAVVGGVYGTNRSETGTFTENIIAGTSDSYIRIASSTDGLSGTSWIDNVSVKEVSTADEIEKAIYDLLMFDSTVSGLVSSRIYPLVIPQGTAYPAIRYNLISAARGHHLTGMTDLVPARFQVSVYSETYAGLRALVDAVRSCLDSTQTTCGTVEIASVLMTDENDSIDSIPGSDQLRVYSRDLDFRITYREA